jgi:hypothetical protein
MPCWLLATAYSIYWQPPSISGGQLLQLQPENMLCHGDRDPLIMGWLCSYNNQYLCITSPNVTCIWEIRGSDSGIFKIQIFWDVTTCWLINSWWTFWSFVVPSFSVLSSDWPTLKTKIVWSLGFTLIMNIIRILCNINTYLPADMV